MAKIIIDHLTFGYEGSPENVFEDLTVNIDSEWKLGLIGRNGRGKTTFLKLLSGEYEGKGQVQVREWTEYFPYDYDPGDERLAAEIVLERFEGDQIWRIYKEMDLMKIDDALLGQRFCDLSSGERAQVLLCTLFARERHFYLIDEPTNHLDMKTRRVVWAYLKKKKGFILASHDRTLLDECVDHIMVLGKNEIEVFKGNFSSWWENKENREKHERSEYERAQKSIRRLEASAKKAEQWAAAREATKIGFDPIKEDRIRDTRCYIGEKSRRMSQRKKNVQRRIGREIDEKKSLLKSVEQADELKMQVGRSRQDTVLQVAHLMIGYEGKTVVGDLSFEIRAGERIALTGENGAGKSSVIRCITGQQTPWEGQVFRAKHMKVSYISQELEEMKGSLEAFIARYQLDRIVFLNTLYKLVPEKNIFEKHIEVYSDGQKRKVMLARSLCSGSDLFIWDEPLNYLDVFSRKQLEDVILSYQPTLLFVEHDASFVENVATSVIELRKEML